MSQHALYRVQIPTTDHLGQPMHAQLPDAAHEWLIAQKPRLFSESWVEGPHRHRQGDVNHLVTIALDDPETDGYVKQLANHIGEMTNHPAIGASKSSKKGSEHWTLPNRKHIPGEGANPAYLHQDPYGVEMQPYAVEPTLPTGQSPAMGSEEPNPDRPPAEPLRA